jgi:hypothetical protein
MTAPLPRRAATLLAILLGTCDPAAPGSGAGGAPKAPVPAPATAEAPGAVRVAIETIAVDRRGTWSVGTDDADLFSGGTGVLEKTATLIGRREQRPPREMARLTARISPTLSPDGGCLLRIESETRAVVIGASAASRPPPPDRRATTVTLKPDEERLLEVYASSVTEARLALKISCGAAPAPGGTGEAGPELVEAVLSIARGEMDGELKPLKTDTLTAAVGREATDLLSFNAPLDPSEKGGKRYRRESLEARLSPSLISGGRVQIAFEVRGEVATVSAGEPAASHPIERVATLVLASGEVHTLDIDVASSGPEEGWSRLRYRLQLVCRF